MVYGDTSQDGRWYAGSAAALSFADFGSKPFADEIGNSPTFRLPLANTYAAPGNDTIDASQSGDPAWTVGLTAYGGGGNDTIRGSRTGDFLAGGSGDDTIFGQGGIDQIYGDSGVNVDVLSRTLTIPTVNRSLAPNADGLVAGADTLAGDGGEDVVFGDHGRVDQDVEEAVVGPNGYFRPAGPEKIQTTLRIDSLATVEPLNGVGDTISGNLGNDILLGGGGGDVISGNEGNDLVFGDFGRVDEGTTDVDVGMPLLPFSFPFPHPFTWTSIDTGAAQNGGADLIRGNAGDDIVLGGQAADRITGGEDDDDLIGGHNVAGGSDVGDFVDGGSGNDWIAGDNADILRTGSRVGPRFRVLSGDAIYDTLGNALVTAAPQADPNAANEERVGHALQPLGDRAGGHVRRRRARRRRRGRRHLRPARRRLDPGRRLGDRRPRRRSPSTWSRPACRSRTGPGSTATGATGSRATAAPTRSSAASARTT